MEERELALPPLRGKATLSPSSTLTRVLHLSGEGSHLPKFSGSVDLNARKPENLREIPTSSFLNMGAKSCQTEPQSQCLHTLLTPETPRISRTTAASFLDDLRMTNEARSPRRFVRAKPSKYHMSLPISFHWTEGNCWFLPGRLRNLISPGGRSCVYQLTIFTMIPWTVCQVLIMTHSTLNQSWLNASLAMASPFPNHGSALS